MNLDRNDMDCNKVNDEDTSGYLDDGGTMSGLDFGGLFSHEFSNVKSFYISPNGSSELFSATRYGRRFMLKGLKKEFRDDPIANIGLVKEFEIGILLDHPNIRRTLSFETIGGIGKVIVMEYVDGCPLQRLLDSGRMSVATARLIARSIVGALDYIHSKGVYHRDIKPSNILVSHHTGTVKIIDFNLSDSNEFIILKNPAGSRKYIAPELLHPGAKPSAAADIYSFGVVADELALHSGDEQLAYAAARCKKTDPVARPQHASEIWLPGSSDSLYEKISDFLASKALTYILSVTCVALIAIIVFFLCNYH